LALTARSPPPGRLDVWTSYLIPTRFSLERWHLILTVDVIANPLKCDLIGVECSDNFAILEKHEIVHAFTLAQFERAQK
jgi:hypothetical protein